MFTLLQSLRVRGSAGEPLPTVFQALDAKGMRILRGQLTLIAAGPGTGKSAFTLTQAMGIDLPAMYFSADSDPYTQLSRAVAIESGWAMHEAEEAVLSGNLGPDITKALAKVPLRMNYAAALTLDVIEDTLESWFEVYEDYPALIVVDNVTNVLTDDDQGGLESLMSYLHGMARDTGSALVGLHHVTGPYNNADKPIPLDGVKGQITGIPAAVWTLHRPSPDTLGVSPVKNRGGFSDPSGNDYAELRFDGSRMQIRDFKEGEYGY